ncbi:MAG: PorP/SprF family type IX secretion system membrane protein [Bacteroidaceae bacterium]|nr:PorP/SprF family type IX secretion system membrane protein [Bacteroidaceae bacterium]
MNTIKRSLFFAVTLCLALSAKAQFDAHFTHFREVENFYNPAAMNRNSMANVTGSLSMQMTGYTNAPVTMFLGGNTALPFDRMKHSLGVVLLNETIGLFTNRRLLFNYAYKIGIKKGWMNIGIQGGVMSEQFNSGKLKTETQNDPAFPSSEERGTVGDLGFGLLYVRGDWYLGASAQHLNFPHVEFGKTSGKTSEMDISPTLYLTGGCNIALRNPLLQVQPAILVESDLKFFRTDISVKGSYTYDSALFYLGATYSPGISVTAMAGGKYRNVLIGYAYEFFTSGVGSLNGSHDLMVSWQTEVDFFKKGKNAHKSVRYL